MNLVKSLFIAAMCLSPLAKVYGQVAFWTKTYPPIFNSNNEQTMSLTSDGDSVLFIGTTHGLYKSEDIGENWFGVIPQGPIHLVAQHGSIVLAASIYGVLYRSEDKGNSWDMLRIGTITEIRDIQFVNDSTIFVSTGHIEIDNPTSPPRFRGEGVYRSTDYGKTWIKKSTGYGDDRYYGKLELAANQTIIMSSNEYSFRDGVIIYSEDLGETWSEIVSINFPIEGGTSSSRIVRVPELVVNNDTMVYMSIAGTAGSNATQLTLVNTLQGMMDGDDWHHLRTDTIGYSWFYNESHQLFFPSSGGIYSNRIGNSFNLDGMRYRPPGGEFFSTVHLDISKNPWIRFDECQFTELKNGVVVVVQAGDSGLYWHTEVPLSVGRKITIPEVSVFPNPTKDILNISIESKGQAIAELHDIYGRTIKQIEFRGSTSIDLQEFTPGQYTITLHAEGQTIVKKILVL